MDGKRYFIRSASPFCLRRSAEASGDASLQGQHGGRFSEPGGTENRPPDAAAVHRTPGAQRRGTTPHPTCLSRRARGDGHLIRPSVSTGAPSPQGEGFKARIAAACAGDGHLIRPGVCAGAPLYILPSLSLRASAHTGVAIRYLFSKIHLLRTLK